MNIINFNNFEYSVWLLWDISIEYKPLKNLSLIKEKLAGAYSLSSLKSKFESNAFMISEPFIQSNNFSKELYLSWLIWYAFNS